MYALDIETIPNELLIDDLPEPEVKLGNVKDLRKIAEKLKDAKDKQQQQMALSPYTGRICAWAAVSAEDDEDRFGDAISDITDAEEVRVIEELFKHVFTRDPKDSSCSPSLITFNGMEFDLPFIYGRMMILGMPMKGYYPLSWWCKRRTIIPHYDLKQVLSNWSGRSKSLAYYAKMILNEEKEELDYATFPDMIREGRCEEILDNCMQHTMLTYKLYERVQAYL